jgi:hypothetical protein
VRRTMDADHEIELRLAAAEIIVVVPAAFPQDG